MLTSEFVDILNKGGQNISCIKDIYFQKIKGISYSFPTFLEYMLKIV